MTEEPMILVDSKRNGLRPQYSVRTMQSVLNTTRANCSSKRNSPVALSHTGATIRELTKMQRQDIKLHYKLRLSISSFP
eukprot:scaffold7250_cov131-Cylindrotheca_fusiformis.AAC.7